MELTMAVDMDQLADLLATTLRDLPKDQFEVMWDSQHYEFAGIYEKHRRKIDGGTSIKRNVVLDHSGHARYRSYFDTKELAAENVHQEIDVHWAQMDTDYSWDVLEILHQKSSVKGYISLIETRRLDALWSLAELFEERGWLTPTNSSDKKHPFGVPYFINMLDAGATTAGFNGKTIRFQDGTTSTICSGLDAATYDKWRNYAATYNRVDNKLLRELRTAILKTRFKPPMSIKSPGKDERGPNVKLYANADQIVELQDLADKRDDNATGKDNGGKIRVTPEGSTLFNGFPFVYIPHLDGVDHNPIYCVDWSKLQPVVHDGYWMVESKPMTDRSQHTTLSVFLDAAHNNLCTNRRTAGFVLHNAIPA